MRTGSMVVLVRVLVLAGVLFASALANANYRCQYNNGIIVEATVCPVGTQILGGTASAPAIGLSGSMYESLGNFGRDPNGRNPLVDNLVNSMGAMRSNSPSQSGRVEAKLKQINEIDALYKSGSISKAQADSLKRSVLGN